MSQAYGASAHDAGIRFRVRSPEADLVELCLFDGDIEQRVAMQRDGEDWVADVPDIGPGQRYGYRAHGEWDPDAGRWFDANKLLVDPYAVELDGPFAHNPKHSWEGQDDTHKVPRAIVPAAMVHTPPPPLHFRRGGLVYEVNVRGFTMLHPDVPVEQRGTIAALAHPAIIAHLGTLHVTAIELMPVTAWIDEAHLPPLGLSNAWGYNPVTFMALDPRLAPGGVAELRDTVAALHAAGIGVILDLVFNHTGESDIGGPVLSLRGLDNKSAYAHADDGSLINDTGCGNTVRTGHPAIRRLIVDSLRHFVGQCGVDGFRFDLAPVLARDPGFDPAAPIFADIAADPLLADRIMIAEPWDIGPGGYQLGNFPSDWLEWNDRYRDDIRRFWKGEAGVAALATRLAGSSDIFGQQTRSVNFLAAHDGFTLADTVAYEERHNEANGEENRDGHSDNNSWNNGVEGPTDDPDILSRRRADVKALLSTLFASAGTIMLTAGDEFGRTQHGNNNAYAQDNADFWIDWAGVDEDLLAHTAALSAARSGRLEAFASFDHDARWLRLDGQPMQESDWQSPDTPGFVLETKGYRVTVDRAARVVGLLLAAEIAPQP